MEAPEVSSPEQALRAYYDAINHQQYARTWLMLAPQFKQARFCCEADGSYQFSRAIAPGGISWPPWKSSIRTSTSGSRTRRSSGHGALHYAQRTGDRGNASLPPWSQSLRPSAG